MRTPGSGGEFGGRRLRALLSHVGIDSKLPLLLTSYTALYRTRTRVSAAIRKAIDLVGGIHDEVDIFKVRSIGLRLIKH